MQVLLAIGLLAVVGAAPQIEPSHPLGDAQNVDEPQDETLAIEHGFAESQGTDEGSESVHDVEEDTETIPEEAIPTQNEDSEDRKTDTSYGFQNDNPGYSFGPEPHHDTLQEEEESAAESSFQEHEGSLPDGPTYQYTLDK